MTEDESVLLSPEYATCGIWTQSGPKRNAERLPVSAALRARIEAWGAWWARSEFYLSPEERRPFDLEGFVAEGRAVAKAVKAELPGWTVRYHDYSMAVCACCEAVEGIVPA